MLPAFRPRSGRSIGGAAETGYGVPAGGPYHVPMRRLAVAAALAAAAIALAAGCGDGVDDVASGPGLSSDETAWAGRYVEWRDAVAEALDAEEAARFEALADGARYRDAVAPLLGCLASLEQALGDAPTQRLDGIRRDLRSACARVEAKVAVLADALDGKGDPVEGIVVAADGVGRVGQALSESDDAIERYSLSRRDLPRAAWPAEGSRLDPVLARAAASTTEGFEADVRCWSRDEWPRVIDEEEVLSGGEITLDSTGAFANPITRQIHMQAPDCEALGRARPSRAGGRRTRTTASTSCGRSPSWRTRRSTSPARGTRPRPSAAGSSGSRTSRSRSARPTTALARSRRSAGASSTPTSTPITSPTSAATAAPTTSAPAPPVAGPGAEPTASRAGAGPAGRQPPM